MIDPRVTKEVTTTVRSSENEFQSFIDSTVWNDILDEVKAWYEDASRAYDSAKTLEEVRLLQGRREACEYFMQLPEQLRDAVIAAKQEEKHG